MQCRSEQDVRWGGRMTSRGWAGNGCALRRGGGESLERIAALGEGKLSSPPASPFNLDEILNCN